MAAGIPLADAFVRVRADASSLKGDVSKALDGAAGEAGKAGTSGGNRFSQAFRGAIGRMAQGLGTVLGSDKIKGWGLAIRGAGANMDEAARKSGGLRGAMRNLGSSVAGFAKQWAGVGIAAAAGGAVILAKQSIQAASDAEQSMGATESVFGRAADAIISKSKTASSQYGLSANEYRENANLIGSLFKNQGVSVDQLAGKTDAMIKVGGDLAATFGGTTKDAVEALGSAYKGEYDPLERYGISLKQSTVNTEAMAVAGVSSVSAFNKLSSAQQTAAKQQATTNLIMKQSASSLGAFGRESNTLAGQQQRLSAMWTDIKAQLGQALIPLLTRLGQIMTTSVMPAISKFITEMQNGSGAGGSFVSLLKTIGSAISTIGGFLAQHTTAVEIFIAAFVGLAGSVRLINGVKSAVDSVRTTLSLAKSAASVFKQGLDAGAAAGTAGKYTTLGQAIKAAAGNMLTMGKNALIAAKNLALQGAAAVANAAKLVAVKTVQLAIAAATRVWAVAQAALNVVMSMNPIGLVVIAIVALVAAVVLAWKNSETFRRVVTAAWNGIKAVVMAVVAWFRTAVPAAWNAVRNATTAAFNAVRNTIRTVWNGIRAVVSAAVSGVKTVVSAGFRLVLAAVKLYLNGVRLYVTTVWRAIRAVVSAAINGIRAVVSAGFNAVAAVVRRVIGVVRAVISSGFNAARAAASAAINGLRNAVSAAFNAVAGVVRRVIGVVRSTISSGFNAARAAAVAAFNSLRNAVGAALNSVVSTVRGLVGRVKGALAGAGGWLIASGRAIIQGLIKGITDMAGRVGDAVKGVLKKARNLLPFSPAKEGPFSGRGWTLYSGQSISNALAQGITDAGGNAVGAAAGVAAKTSAALKVNPQGLTAPPRPGAVASTMRMGLSGRSDTLAGTRPQQPGGLGQGQPLTKEDIMDAVYRGARDGVLGRARTEILTAGAY